MWQCFSDTKDVFGWFSNQKCTPTSKLKLPSFNLNLNPWRVAEFSADNGPCLLSLQTCARGTQQHPRGTTSVVFWNLSGNSTNNSQHVNTIFPSDNLLMPSGLAVRQKCWFSSNAAESHVTSPSAVHQWQCSNSLHEPCGEVSATRGSENKRNGFCRVPGRADETSQDPIPVETQSVGRCVDQSSTSKRQRCWPLLPVILSAAGQRAPLQQLSPNCWAALQKIRCQKNRSFQLNCGCQTSALVLTFFLSLPFTLACLFLTLNKTLFDQSVLTCNQAAIWRQSQTTRETSTCRHLCWRKRWHLHWKKKTQLFPWHLSLFAEDFWPHNCFVSIFDKAWVFDTTSQLVFAIAHVSSAVSDSLHGPVNGRQGEQETWLGGPSAIQHEQSTNSLLVDMLESGQGVLCCFLVSRDHIWCQLVVNLSTTGLIGSHCQIEKTLSPTCSASVEVQKTGSAKRILKPSRRFDVVGRRHCFSSTDDNCFGLPNHPLFRKQMIACRRRKTRIPPKKNFPEKCPWCGQRMMTESSQKKTIRCQQFLWCFRSRWSFNVCLRRSITDMRERWKAQTFYRACSAIDLSLREHWLF